MSIINLSDFLNGSYSGYTGSKGDNGYTGSKGETGPQGPQGEDASIITAENAPSEPLPGTLWFRTLDGALYFWYNDGDSSQWVGISGPQGEPGETGIGIPIGGNSGQILSKNSTTDYDTVWVDPFSTESPTFTGAINLNGSVKSAIQTVSLQEINCGLSNYFVKTVSSPTTFTVTNVPATGSYVLVIKVVNGGSAVVQWPNSFKWSKGTAPTLVASGIDIVVAITDNGGTTWMASTIKDIK